MNSRIDWFNSLPDNVLCIVYPFAWRGHALARVVQAHDEVYWDKHFCRMQHPVDFHERGDNPLAWPELFDHFSFLGEGRNQSRISGLPSGVFDYTIVHGSIHLGNLSNLEYAERMYSALKTTAESTDKLVCAVGHLDRFTGTDDKPHATALSALKRQCLVTRASNPDELWSRSETYSTISKRAFLYENLLIDRVYHVDITRLFSPDYHQFLEEYIALCKHYDFTPRINSIRAFILRYLERESFMFNRIVPTLKKSNLRDSANYAINKR